MAEHLKMGPNGRPQLLAERCSSCVFRSGDPMRLGSDRLRNLIRDNLAADALLTCHQTLSYGSHSEVGQSACRGFWDAYGTGTAAGRFALLALGGMDEVSAPGADCGDCDGTITRRR